METSIFGDVIDYSDMTQSKKKCKKNDYTKAEIIGTAGSVASFLEVIFDPVRKKKEDEEERKKMLMSNRQAMTLKSYSCRRNRSF